MQELFYGDGVEKMNLYPGIATFIISVVVFYTIRYLMNRRLILSSQIIERNMRVTNMEGCYTGPIVYIVTILVLIIGPVSYDIFRVTSTQYILLNFIAGFIFVYLYSPFAPITGFSTITIYEKNGIKYCMVGEILGRKYKIRNISMENGISVSFKRGRGECTLSAITPIKD